MNADTVNEQAQIPLFDDDVALNSNIAYVQARIDNTTAVLNHLKAELIELQCNQEIECGGKGGCGHKTKIRDIKAIQTRWYVPPRGCSEGAYWTDHDHITIICQGCGCEGRMTPDHMFYHLKHKFAETKTECRD